MVRKMQGAFSLSPDDSDTELQNAFQRELDGHRKATDNRRKRKGAPRTQSKPGQLRRLLGFLPGDDYIEAGRLSASSVSGDETNRAKAAAVKPLAWTRAAPQSSVAVDESSLRRKRKASRSSSSSQEEYVLSAGPNRRAPTDPEPASEAAEPMGDSPTAVVGTDHSSLSETESDDFEFNLAPSKPFRNASSVTVPRMTGEGAMKAHDRQGGASSDSEDEEPVLSVRPSGKPKPSQQVPCRIAVDSSTPAPLANALQQGQRPGFPASAEQAFIGGLELGEGCRVPASINRFLRDYQRDGVRFFFRSYSERRGALLGDDMGLGKTIQVIAFLSAIMGKTGLESDADQRIEAVRSGRQAPGYQRANATWATCLIICPSSVIDNWRDELDTWGYFEHGAFTGAKAKQALEAFRRARLDILITSHETASINIAELEGLDLSCVLIDEAHKLKNPGSQLTRAMHRFKCPVKLALTGTAIQNSYRELYTLADWINPGLLGSVREWQLEIEEPLKRGQRKDASEEWLADARTRAEKLVKNVLPLFFLRRTKALIQDQLPRKYDKVVFCPLTTTQLEVYKRILAEPEVDFMKRHADPCDCAAIDPETGLPYRRQNCCYKRDDRGSAWNKHMLKYIYLLQKCSNHVALVFPDPEDAGAAEQERRDRHDRQLSYVRIMFPDAWRDKRCNAANGMNEDYCGKWKVLAGLLKQWRSDGDKVLLFSTNIRLLQFIEFFISREGYNFCRLDGSTPQGKRQALVNQFNRDAGIFIFLISTTAGGTGLNLTAANKVVVFDPHWNPSHDLQAMDRAYRFGQTRDVNVYRLIGAGSLEECIYGRQIYKQQQMQIGYTAIKERRYFEGVAGDQEHLGELFGCKNLFKLQEGGVETKSIIDECNIAEVGFALERYLEGQVRREGEASDETLLELINGGEAGLQTQTQTQTADARGKPGETNAPDPIKSILDSAGVRYTHLNNEVTGGSKAEAQMSKDAQRKAQTRKAARTKLDPSTGKASTSTVSWPPPRPRKPSKVEASSVVPRAAADSEKLVHTNMEAVRSAVSSGRAPSLQEIAQLEGQTEAQLASRVREMSSREQKRFFDRAMQRLRQGLER